MARNSRTSTSTSPRLSLPVSLVERKRLGEFVFIHFESRIVLQNQIEEKGFISGHGLLCPQIAKLASPTAYCELKWHHYGKHATA